MQLEAVFLDAGPVSMAARRPGANSESDACQQWVKGLVAAGVTVYVPEIADYETRRELVRVGVTDSIRRLDTFISAPGWYISLITPAMREAARLWAAVRNANLTTAAPAALDGDAILAGQVWEYCLLQDSHKSENGRSNRPVAFSVKCAVPDYLRSSSSFPSDGSLDA